ncbi:MAG: bL35 family ribosomal protein [Candidatus Kuenenbacteria bacterium]
MIKSHKSITKRFRKTKTGKILHRVCGQDHFNAREKGKTTRAKRRDKVLSPAFRKALKKLF